MRFWTTVRAFDMDWSRNNYVSKTDVQESNADRMSLTYESHMFNCFVISMWQELRSFFSILLSRRFIRSIDFVFVMKQWIGQPKIFCLQSVDYVINQRLTHVFIRWTDAEIQRWKDLNDADITRKSWQWSLWEVYQGADWMQFQPGR